MGGSYFKFRLLGHWRAFRIYKRVIIALYFSPLSFLYSTMTLVSSFQRLAISRPVQQYRTYVAAKQLRPTKFKSSKFL